MRMLMPCPENVLPHLAVWLLGSTIRQPALAVADIPAAAGGQAADDHPAVHHGERGRQADAARACSRQARRTDVREPGPVAARADLDDRGAGALQACLVVEAADLSRWPRRSRGPGCAGRPPCRTG